MPEIITRSQAIARGLKTYFTGQPCIRGGIAERKVRAGECQCDACKAHRSSVATAYYEANKADIAQHRAKLQQAKTPEEKAAEAEKLREWRKNNPERAKAINAKYREANRERITARQREWRKNNPEKCRAAKAAWEAANPEKVLAHQRAYHAKKRAEKKAVEETYWFDQESAS